MLWDVDVKDVHCVEVNSVKTTTRAVEHLQPLSLLYRQIYHDWPIRQMTKRLYNTYY